MKQSFLRYFPSVLAAAVGFGAAGVDARPSGTPPSSAVWGKTVVSESTVGASYFNGITSTSVGASIIAGTVNVAGTYDFGNGAKLTGTSNYSNPLLIKYDTNALPQWVQGVKSGSADAMSFGAVTQDTAGNLYVAGNAWQGNYDFGNGVTQTVATVENSAFIAKYDANGVAQWVKLVNAPVSNTFSFLYRIVVDSAGNIYAAGEISKGTYDFGNGVTATGAGSSFHNVVVVKYDANGLAQWAKTVGANGNSSKYESLSVDSAGNVYAVGTLSGSTTYDFGNGATVRVGAYPSIDFQTLAIVKYNAAGVTQWAQTVSSSYTQFSNYSGVVVDATGNVFAAGEIDGSGNETFDFGNGVKIKDGSTNGGGVVLVKYNSDGAAQWAQTTASAQYTSEFYGLTLDGAGNIYAVGGATGSGTAYDFGNGVTLKAQGNYSNTLIVKYSAAGLAQWAQASSTNTTTSPGANFVDVATDNAGYVYPAGTVSGRSTYNFGNNVTVKGVSSSSQSVLLVKYGATLNGK